MLLAPALADRAILPKAWGSSYFFNRIGRLQPVTTGTCRPEAAGHSLVIQQDFSGDDSVS
ncbi:hypothetical protein Pstu14405_21240 [Stutzerimonas stutzeri]|nr:hypothetical protein Pstu14405_21240 [Stutzerimonas stutzeri]